MYNTEIKNDFLEREALSSHKNKIKVAFIISEEMEREHDKDVFDFNLEQIGALFTRSELSDKKKARVLFNALESYIDWATCQGYKRSNINPLSMIESNWTDQFISK